MRFIDQVRILARAGNGGDGAVAWRREKFVPMGGPAGGDGGRGGSVILVADHHVSTLLDLKYRQRYKAKSGQPGANKRKNGKSGGDIVIKVPIGTVVYFEADARDGDDRPPWLDKPDTSEFGLGSDDGGMENLNVFAFPFAVGRLHGNGRRIAIQIE